MTSLVHVDMEFTNDNPEMGEVMQIAMIAHDFDQQKYADGEDGFLFPESVEFEMLVKVEHPERATRWVLDNQMDLMIASQEKGHSIWFVRNALISFFESANQRFGGPSILSGWCVANDYVFMRKFLPGYDGISYRTLELEDVVAGLSGIFSVTEDDLADILDVRRQDDEAAHTAMGDVKFQMRAMRAALRGSQRRK